MDLVAGLRMKGARERAWLVGDPTWMRRWLIERANAGQGSNLELKSRFGAKCLELAAAHAPGLTRKALPTSQRDLDGGNSVIPHWLFEPRIPAGNGVESGRWTTLAGDVPQPAGDAQGLPGDTAANAVSIGHNQGPPLDEKPEIPVTRPDKSKKRTEGVRRALNYSKFRGAGTLSALIATSPWLAEYQSDILAAHIAPDMLENLQANVSTPAAGYEIHHIVERTPAENEGFPESLINGPENLVRIPKLIHRDISAWYSTNNPDYGNMTPRDYLRGKSWEERRAVGLQAMRLFGVLKQ